LFWEHRESLKGKGKTGGLKLKKKREEKKRGDPLHKERREQTWETGKLWGSEI